MAGGALRSGLSFTFTPITCHFDHNRGILLLHSQNINALGRKARDGSISIDEMAGGTFTISNGGVYGSMLSTPIINPPQSAILGMHNITQRAMVVGKNIESRPMMYIALTYDHRLIDGREVRCRWLAVTDVFDVSATGQSRRVAGGSVGGVYVAD
jgi:hypothetical protein